MKAMMKSMATTVTMVVALVGLGACSTVDQQARDQAAAAMSAAQQAEQDAQRALVGVDRVEHMYSSSLRK